MTKNMPKKWKIRSKHASAPAQPAQQRVRVDPGSFAPGGAIPWLPRHADTSASLKEFGPVGWVVLEVDRATRTVTLTRPAERFSTVDVTWAAWQQSAR